MFNEAETHQAGIPKKLEVDTPNTCNFPMRSCKSADMLYYHGFGGVECQLVCPNTFGVDPKYNKGFSSLQEALL